MAKADVDIAQYLKQFISANVLAGEGGDNARRRLGIRQPRQTRNIVMGKRWPLVRHVEAAIAREAREQNIFKAQGWRAAARTHIVQISVPRFGLSWHLDETVSACRMRGK